MKALILAVMSLALGACFVPQGRAESRCDRAFTVRPGFTVPQRRELEAAVTRWNYIAEEQFCIVEGYSTKSYIYPRTIEEVEGGWRVGYYVSEDDSVGVVTTLSLPDFGEIALHELGHAHGLDHAPAPAVMHYAAGTSKVFTDNDIAECQRVGACR